MNTNDFSPEAIQLFKTIVEALRDSTFVAAMLDAICETDGTVDRMRARDAAYRVREALQAHAAEAAQAAEPVAWRSKKNDHDWCYFHGPKDPREVHDHGGTYQPLYTRPQPAQDANK